MMEEKKMDNEMKLQEIGKIIGVQRNHGMEKVKDVFKKVYEGKWFKGFLLNNVLVRNFKNSYKCHEKQQQQTSNNNLGFKLKD